MIETLKEFQIKLGRELKKYRTRAKMSQEDLADKARISFQVISGVETGRNLPSLKTLYRISEALQVPVPYFFDFYFETFTERKDDLEFLNKYNMLSEGKKKVVLNLIDSLIEEEK